MKYRYCDTVNVIINQTICVLIMFLALIQWVFTFSIFLTVLFVLIITIFYTPIEIIILIQEPYFTLTAQENQKRKHKHYDVSSMVIYDWRRPIWWWLLLCIISACNSRCCRKFSTNHTTTVACWATSNTRRLTSYVVSEDNLTVTTQIHVGIPRSECPK